MPFSMPTMPTIEPLPSSKNERLIGKRPPLLLRVRHYWRQLVPTPNFIWKWCAVGSFGAAAATAFGIMLASSFMDGDNTRAREERAARTKEIKRKADLEGQRLAQEEAFKVLTTRAISNWEAWKSQFTTDQDGIVCAHGSNKERTNYEISCQLGPKGKLPTNRVICNQGACGTPEPITPPPKPPEPKK